MPLPTSKLNKTNIKIRNCSLRCVVYNQHANSLETRQKTTTHTKKNSYCKFDHTDDIFVKPKLFAQNIKHPHVKNQKSIM